MSDKQNLKDLVQSYTKAKQEASEIVTKAEAEIQQAREDSEG